MYARIGTFEAPPQRLNEVVAFFRDRVVSAFHEHEGFLGYRAYVDRDRGRLVGISLWATRSGARRQRPKLHDALEVRPPISVP